MSFRQLIFNNTIKNVISIQFRLRSCWSCGNEVKNMSANLFCSSCNALQEPDKKENYFKVMGVSESYDLDENNLTKKYKQLQKYLHPDKYATRDTKEQEISAHYSSLVNEAYKTLLEPLARGIYMLHLRGKEIPENTEIDQQFLMTIMEKNEEVENATSKEELLNLNKENKTIMKSLQKQISQAFFDGDIKRVTKLLGVMKYYTSIDNQIQSSIRSKGIIQ